MPLVVHTAYILTADPDRLDVTRMGTWLSKERGTDPAPLGEAFAPSWPLLRKMKAGRLSFEDFEARYVAEMRASYRERRAAWVELLAKPRVVLVCYCESPVRCHRRLLAAILEKLGAEVRGELLAAE